MLWAIINHANGPSYLGGGEGENSEEIGRGQIREKRFN